MHQITEKGIVNKNIEPLFEFTQDFEKRIQWDSQTKSITFMNSESELKKGVQVTVISNKGVKMDTEYTIFTPPHKLSIIMLNESTIFKSFNGTWEYRSISDNRTELTITYEFELQPFYSIISPLVNNRIRKNIKSKLSDLASVFVNR